MSWFPLSRYYSVFRKEKKNLNWIINFIIISFLRGYQSFPHPEQCGRSRADTTHNLSIIPMESNYYYLDKFVYIWLWPWLPPTSSSCIMLKDLGFVTLSWSVTIWQRSQQLSQHWAGLRAREPLTTTNVAKNKFTDWIFILEQHI